MNTDETIKLRALLEAYFHECQVRGFTYEQANAKLMDVVDAALLERQAKRRASLPVIVWHTSSERRATT